MEYKVILTKNTRGLSKIVYSSSFYCIRPQIICLVLYVYVHMYMQRGPLEQHVRVFSLENITIAAITIWQFGSLQLTNFLVPVQFKLIF